MAKILDLVLIILEALKTMRFHTEFVDSEAKGRELIEGLRKVYVANHWHVRENKDAVKHNGFCLYALKCETHVVGRKQVVNLYLYQTERGRCKVTVQR